MSYYLIDYENTKSAGLAGIDKLTETDKIWLFYSENANTMTFHMHKLINECKAEFNFEEVAVGTKNALDFQLVTYTGYLVAQNWKEQFYIVTKDKGFESVAKFWSSRNVKVEVVADLTRRNEAVETNQMLEQVLAVIPDKNAAKKITALIEKYKTKQGLNNALVREFPSQDNKRASEYYKAIKPLLKEKK